MPKPKSIDDGADSVLDNMLDLRALVKFALHQVKHSTPEEFAAFRSEWCTMMYLIREKIDLAYDTIDEVGVLARRLPKDGEPLH